MMLMFRCYLVFVCLMTVACSNEPAGPINEVIPIKGDPMTFVKNTKMDASQGIPISLFKESSKWSGSYRIFMTEEREQYESAQALVDKHDPDKREDYDVESSKSSIAIFSMPALDEETNNGSEIDMKSGGWDTYKFEVKNGALYLKDFSKGQDRNTVPYMEVLHYSYTPNKRVFSVLYKVEVGTFKALAAVYFVKYEYSNLVLRSLNTAYNYLFGSGVKVNLNQQKNHYVWSCMQSGSLSIYSDLITEGVNAWQSSLNGRLRFYNGHEVGKCPPFSDVNSKTIFHVDRWVEIHGDMGGYTAFVTPVADLYRGEIVDTDMFILESRWTKNYTGSEHIDMELLRDRIASSYRETIIHEVGHMLGLAHEFDENIVSVMSYDDVDYVTAHDQKVVQELYPSL